MLDDTVVGADIQGLPQGRFAICGEEFMEGLQAAERNLRVPADGDFSAGFAFRGCLCSMTPARWMV